MRDPILITGGAGFIGCNLADALLSAGERVVIADNFSRPGVDENAGWLERRHGQRLRVEEVDVRDRDAIRPLVLGARQVYHLAAQVAVTTAVRDPREDLEVNLLGTFNVLEAARSARRRPAILFTSTNKVYGALEQARVERTTAGYRLVDLPHGVGESTPLDFHSPYGCSKGAADQYALDYARIYGVPTVVLRMSCVYGERQHGNEDQGWVAHFGRAVLEGQPITIYGDGYQVRDILWVGDLVRLMRLASERAEMLAGSAFNVGGGPANAVSLGSVVSRLSEIVGREVPIRFRDWRPGDQRVYVSDLRRAARVLRWKPTVSWDDGLERLVQWLRRAALDDGVAPRAAAAGGTRLAVRPAV